MRVALATALAVALATVPAAAGGAANPDASLAKRGLDRSVQIGALQPEDADSYRAELDRAVGVLAKL